MTTRPIETLLQIVIDSLKEGDKKGFENTGICWEVDDLYTCEIINEREYDILNNFIEDNKEKAIADFSAKASAFWWPAMRLYPEYRQVRIDFLQSLLSGGIDREATVSCSLPIANPHHCPECSWQCTCSNQPCSCCSDERSK